MFFKKKFRKTKPSDAVGVNGAPGKPRSWEKRSAARSISPVCIDGVPDSGGIVPPRQASALDDIEMAQSSQSEVEVKNNAFVVHSHQIDFSSAEKIRMMGFTWNRNRVQALLVLLFSTFFLSLSTLIFLLWEKLTQ